MLVGNDLVDSFHLLLNRSDAINNTCMMGEYDHLPEELRRQASFE